MSLPANPVVLELVRHQWRAPQDAEYDRHSQANELYGVYHRLACHRWKRLLLLQAGDVSRA